MEDAGPGRAEAAGEEAVHEREDDEHADLVAPEAPEEEDGQGAAEARDEDDGGGGEARVVEQADEERARDRG